MSAPRTAIYSTVFPGVEPFVRDWYESLVAQEDRDFDLWIGSDSLGRKAIDSAAGRHVEATLVFATPADTPASLRRRTLAQMVSSYDLVLFVDSDDVALPARVARARCDTGMNSLSACALTIIDESGADLGTVMDVGEPPDWASVLPWRNIFGLSNTAYGTELLRELLDFPDDCEIIDWNLATRSWLKGAQISFDHEPLMRYRQYSRNTARVLAPFSADQVRSAATLVLRHFNRLPWGGATGSHEQWGLLRDASRRVESFAASIGDQRKLDRYVRALNQLGGSLLWWECVANPALEAEWTT